MHAIGPCALEVGADDLRQGVATLEHPATCRADLDVGDHRCIAILQATTLTHTHTYTFGNCSANEMLRLALKLGRWTPGVVLSIL